MTKKCYGEQVETETKQRLFRLYNVNPIKCVITQFFTIIDKTTPISTTWSIVYVK